MIKVKTTLTCEYEISRSDENRILRYMKEYGLSLKETVEKLQKDEVIDILFGSVYNEKIVKINEVEFEEEEKEEIIEF